VRRQRALLPLQKPQSLPLFSRALTDRWRCYRVAQNSFWRFTRRQCWRKASDSCNQYYRSSDLS